MVAGCARHPDQRPSAAPRARPESRTCHAARVQPAPQRGPDCEFKGADLKTVDPLEFARLKAAYERQCRQRAEKAERNRLRRLRASKGCD
jgi:hypothetical protein